jgi:hypothetical protein
VVITARTGEKPKCLQSVENERQENEKLKIHKIRPIIVNLKTPNKLSRTKRSIHVKIVTAVVKRITQCSQIIMIV